MDTSGNGTGSGSVTLSPGPGEYSGNATRAPPPTTNYGNGAPPPHQQPQWLRFVKTLVVAVLVYALVGLLAESTYLAAKHRAWHQNRVSSDLHYHLNLLPEWYDLPSDVKVFECTTSNAWSKTTPTSQITSGKTTGGPLPPWRYPFASNTSFDLRLGSGGVDDDSFVLLLSRGRWLTGDVTIVSGGNNKEGQATVNVEVGYAREDTRDKVRACFIEREDGAKGVGIFTPKYEGSSLWVEDDHARQIHHHTTIVLPDGRPGPLNVRKLETDLPNSSQRFEVFGLWNHFKHVTLKGSSGMIDAGPDLKAERVTIEATDAPVIGNIFVTKELDIQTSNASVEATVVLDYRQEQDNVPKMDIKTSNGVVKAESHKKPPTPHFEIKATTSNARLNVGVHHAALGRGDPVIHFEELQLSCPEFEQNGKCPYGVTIVREEIVKKGHLKGEMEWTEIVTIPEPTGKPSGETLKKRKKLESTAVLRTSNASAVLAA
ncbi:hypothetical protein BKA70DRAFT_1560892 [Coprinopsis sp. MPI-PUGE-AT-0042]|nr:hypothetical protein BKA70DRAFT_1560892 [Coprinopsis sp. MPI-PUGE-AT-0042]